MRFLLTALALLVIAMPQAQASERISVNEIHNLVNNINRDLNSSNIAVGRDALAELISENAIFDNRLNVYNPGWNVHGVHYGHNFHPLYHRYPYAYAPYRSQVSTRSISKWEHIGQFENKKRLIPGYSSNLTITNISMRPYARTAVVDVDLKEFSVGYNPYNAIATGRVMHANSKCKAYLSKKGNDLFMTRMDCNTNTSLPM